MKTNPAKSDYVNFTLKRNSSILLFLNNAGILQDNQVRVLTTYFRPQCYIGGFY